MLEEEFFFIFQHFEALLAMTSELLQLLDQRLDTWESNFFGDVFLDKVEYYCIFVVMFQFTSLRYFVDYTDHYNDIQQLLFTCKKRSEQLCAILKARFFTTAFLIR